MKMHRMAKKERRKPKTDEERGIPEEKTEERERRKVRETRRD